MTAGVARWSSGRPRSLTLAFYRHALILVGAAVVVALLGRSVPIEANGPTWYVVMAVVALLAGLLSGWLGLVFLVSGLAAGAALDLAIRHSSTADAAAYLEAAAVPYAVGALVAIVAFAIAVLARRAFSSRA